MISGASRSGRLRFPRRPALWGLFLVLALSAGGCISRLQEAKLHYAEGQRFSGLYQTEKALASYQRALLEAAAEAESRPSGQAFLLKGLAEINLEKWKDAERSFLDAAAYGFDEGEEWARQVSILGLTETFEELGFGDAALQSYSYLLGRSKLRPVLFRSALKYTEAMLSAARAGSGPERAKKLSSALDTVSRLSEKDFGCGYYHYLQSQILGHLGEHGRSFEQAALAREMKLPSEKISRDNDLQIVFCYRELKRSLPAGEFTAFECRYSKWARKWGWPGPETPDWKKE